MKDLIKISIIVPVYNAEKYLHRCIDSVLSQTFTDWEMLLVDDGSTDDSLKLLKNLAKKDSRIRVYHKENGGVSSTRQYALDLACGKYVIHADPDDWCDSQILLELYEKAESQKADMVLCDYYMHINCHDYYIAQKPRKLSARSIQKQIFNQELFGSLWNKLVRLDVIRKYNIKFPKEINLWEDAWFNCELLFHPIKIAYQPMAYYHYDFHTNPNSMVRNINRNTVFQQKTFISHFEKKNADKRSLFVTKSCVLEVAFYNELFKGDEIRRLFPEINSKYIACKFFKKQALCQCLLGNDKYSVFLRKTALYEARIIANLKKSIKKVIHYE